MRVAIGFNADLPVTEILDGVKIADISGFESYWMHEHSFGRDAISYLGAAAISTKNIKLGVACLTPFVRHPVSLAVTMATIQETSHGRGILGLGTGFPMRLDLMGIRHDKPIGALKETMEICRAIWTGSVVNYAGKVYSLKNVKALVPTTQIPIYLAGWKSQMLHLAGRHADGYVAKGGESTTSLRQIVSTINSVAKDPTRIDIAAYLLTIVAESKQVALEKARRDPFVAYMLSVQDDYLYEGTGIDPKLKKPIAENYFKGNLPGAFEAIKDEMLESFTLLGTSDQVAARVREYTASGLKLPILQPISMKREDIVKVLEAGGMLIGEKDRNRQMWYLKSAKIPRLAVPHELVYRLFYPQVPMVLSAKSGSAVAGMPAVSCMSLSTEPALVAVAVGKSLRTIAVMKNAKNFGINWINFNKRKILELLSTPAKNVDKLKAAGIPYMRLLGTPVLKDSIAYVICEKTRSIETGDHTLFLGKVVGAMASLDFDEYWRFSEYRPVLYRGSSFRAPFTTMPRTN